MPSMAEQLKALYSPEQLEKLGKVSAALHENPSILDNEKDHAHQALKDSGEAQPGRTTPRTYF